MLKPTFFMAIVVTTLSNAAYGDIDRDTAHAVCTQLGLTPESVTVLGFNGAQAQSAFERLEDHEQTVSLYQQQASQRQSLMQQLDALKRSIRFLESAADVQQGEQQISTLNGQITSLSQSISGLQTQLRTVFLGIQDIDLVDRVCQPEGLSAIVPSEFRVVDLRDEDYMDLFAALNAERRAQANGQHPDTDTQLTLSRYRNIPAVQHARSNLLYNLDAVRVAFND